MTISMATDSVKIMSKLWPGAAIEIVNFVADPERLLLAIVTQCF